MFKLILGALALAVAPLAIADVSAKHEPYLKKMPLGESASKVIANLGPPDFVVLAADGTEAASELKRYGFARRLYWTVKGCQPVKIDFDARGKSDGANFVALKYCMKDAAALLTPAAEFSCKQKGRAPFCK
ncbi:MAG: hypothetical protein EOP84_00285 [Verrucomicrobiaceae bacterium]|nr:MAG: hypothetical protein EOP84_00285 [Verrucomicrobiaceae bacterium]